MKKFGLILTALIFTVVQVFAQDVKKEKDPDEQIIVNKNYDDKGNLIQYDSTYIHQWSSDSTFQFLFPDNDFFAGNGFPDLNEFFNQFMGDSAIRNFGFSPFNNDDFFSFQHEFTDSMFSKNLPFAIDSTFQYFNSDSLGNFPHGNTFPDIHEFYDLMNKQFHHFTPHNFNFPEINTPAQQEELKELLKKHQKEMEELRKKWNENEEQK